MLEHKKAIEIERYLEDGFFSQRRIATICGVSRSAVRDIKKKGTAKGRIKSDFQYPSGKFIRCRFCGGLVQMPCLLCTLRNQRKNKLREFEA